MEQRVSAITFGVSDLPGSRGFYGSLGWKPVNTNANAVVLFQTGGMARALYPRVELANDANVAPEGIGFSGITLASNTRNRHEVDSVLACATAAGGKLRKPAQEAFWGGCAGYFSDPDGFVWEVAWNPFFAISGDGSIRIPADL